MPEVRAPFVGLVTVLVAPEQQVAAGDPVAVIEAMKLEAPITAPSAGVVSHVAVRGAQQVRGGDLVLVLDHLDAPDRARAGA